MSVSTRPKVHNTIPFSKMYTYVFTHTQNYQGSVQSQAITFNANDAVKIVSDPGWVNNDQPVANNEEWTYDQRNVQNNNDQQNQVCIYPSK